VVPSLVEADKEVAALLVIAVDTSSLPPDRVAWTGRRHDDDGPDPSHGNSADDLFQTVFHALHDGEQVAVGFDCSLSRPLPAELAAGDGSVDESGMLRLIETVESQPCLDEMTHLLRELGNWRPWTRISTSLQRWRATTSVLVWEAIPTDRSDGEPTEAAVRSFYRRLRSGADDTATERAEPVVNLAVAVARQAGLTVDSADLTRPLLSIPVTGAASS
jgi:hypothetical protein